MVVPQIHMTTLWDLAVNRGTTITTEEEPSILKDMFQSFRDGGHADTWVKEGYWKKVDEFFTATIDWTGPPLASAATASS